MTHTETLSAKAVGSQNALPEMDREGTPLSSPLESKSVAMLQWMLK